MNLNKNLFLVLLSFFILLFWNCSTLPFVESAVRPLDKKGEKEEKPENVSDVKKEGEKAESGKEELDFSMAFVSGTDREKTIEKAEKDVSSGTDKTGSYSVWSSLARIRLGNNISHTVVYYVDSVDIRLSDSDRRRKRVRGRIAVKQSGSGSVYISIKGVTGFKTALPCTLDAVSKHNFFEYEGKSYRGSVIFGKSYKSGFTLINYIPVESYLRGVVALEIGNRPMEEIEAVKAQAVAARTYTYKRMEKNRENRFDLVATVADQVYGGVAGESPVSDIAVRSTRNQIMAHDGEIIHAYYHSTCGGKTANIEDVWNKDAQPYLQSVKDVDHEGRPYCSISRYFSWTEAWPMSKLSDIIASYSKSAFPEQHSVKGELRDIKIVDRYKCGRIKKCRFSTTSGKYYYGGDRIRFLLRRNVSGRPILRSSNFKVEEMNNRRAVLKGNGYGHGVGMCQMGAVGRARAGQRYEEILSSYYKGIKLVTIKEKK